MGRRDTTDPRATESTAGREEIEDRLDNAEIRYRMLVEQVPAITYVDAADEVSSTVYISPQRNRCWVTHRRSGWRIRGYG